MKKVETISVNTNYSAINVGKLDELMEHSLIHPVSGMEIKGKVFTKDALKATGSEISFQILPPETELGYFHSHIQNEEIYIILKGSGDYQVDDDVFPISEGSMIRIAPEGKRSLRNTSSKSMVFMVVQAKESSLIQHTSDDGLRVKMQPNWK